MPKNVICAIEKCHWCNGKTSMAHFETQTQTQTEIQTQVKTVLVWRKKPKQTETVIYEANKT